MKSQKLTVVQRKPMCKILTFSCLLSMRQSALWAAETWDAEYRLGTIGADKERDSYLNILSRIERAMRKFERAVA